MPKPAPAAGLVLFVGNDFWSDYARLVLAEKDVDGSRVERIVPGKPNEDLLVLNPEQRLPALADRDVMITGARVIAEYLDERYPHPRLLSTDPVARARLRMALDRFEQDVLPALKTVTGERNAGKAQTAAATTLAMAGRWFGKGYFLGTDYSLADAAWAVWLKQMRPHAASWPEPVQRYAAKLWQRKAVSGTLGKL